MSVLQKLNLPTALPRWATDPGVTLEPAEGEKDTGWSLSERPPARWMNWLQNLAYQWVKSLGGAIIGNTMPQNDIDHSSGSPHLVDSLIYNPTIGYWCGVSSNETQSWLSKTGYVWSESAPFFGGFSPAHSIDNWDNGFVAPNYAASHTSYGIYTVGVGWAASNNVDWGTDPVTVGDDIEALATAYPDDDRLVVAARNGTQVYVRIGTVNGTVWTGAATNPPNSGLGRAYPKRVLYLGGTSWGLFYTNSGYEQAAISVSTDNGSTWTVGTSNKIPEFYNIYDAAYNPDTGRLIVVGSYEDPGDGYFYQRILYSDDLGASWVPALESTSVPVVGGNWGLEAVYYCGGDLWIAAGRGNIQYLNNIWVSSDNGASWGLATGIIQDTSGYSLPNFRAIACNGKTILLTGYDYALWKTLSVV